MSLALERLKSEDCEIKNWREVDVVMVGPHP